MVSQCIPFVFQNLPTFNLRVHGSSNNDISFTIVTANRNTATFSDIMATSLDNDFWIATNLTHGLSTDIDMTIATKTKLWQGLYDLNINFSA